MTKKDYYAVLGIPRDASAACIRDAFHHLALRHHPDRAGSHSTESFQEIMEAYEVLSDARQRQRYDRRLDMTQRRSQHGAELSRSRHHAPTAAAVEPLIPDPSARRRHRSFASGEHRFGRGPGRQHWADPRPTYHQAQAELWLDAEQAARGGWLHFELELLHPCPHCRGRRRALFPCLLCGGRTALPVRRPLALHVRPGTRDGTVVTGHIGHPGAELSLLLRVRQ